MSGIKVEELFNEITQYIPSTSTITIIGRMRSGKSTFARLYSEYLKKRYESQGYTVYYTLFDPQMIDRIEELEQWIRDNSQDVNILIFDDLSFKFAGNSKFSRDFFNMITRIAHITLSDYNYVFFIGHYSRSISPFLRASNVNVLTSITHPEISGLKELFTLSSLYDFLYYHETNPKRFIFLIRYHTFERIIDFTIDRLAKPRTKREILENPFDIEPFEFR
jgi:hypothetical protein